MLSLGIDCSQLSHSFCLMEESGRVRGERSFPETQSGLAAVHTQVQGHGLPRVVVMEASGHYWQNLHAALRDWGWPVVALDPQRAHQAAQWDPPRHETDKADARTLGRLGFREASASLPATPAVTVAHALSRAIDQRVRLMNQLHALLVVANPALIACGWDLDAARTLAVLQASPTTRELRRARTLAQVRFGARHKVGASAAAALQAAAQEALCGALQAEHAELVRFLVSQIRTWSEEITRRESQLARLLPQAQSLLAIPGVGLRTALIVTACVPFAQLRSAKQAAAHVGLHPHRLQSGQHAWTRLSKRGDAVARLAVYRVARPLRQHNPRLRSFYQRRRDRGLTDRQALCAVAHKLVRVCYAVLTSGPPYSPSYGAQTP